MSKEAINRTIEAIKDDAGRRMKMGSFCSNDDELCNTSFCIAGWLVASQPGFIYTPGFRFNIEATATELLKKTLSFQTIYDLFYLNMSDEESKELVSLPDLGIMEFFDSLPKLVRMDAAIKVLEILRDTKKVKWFDAIKYAILKRPSKKKPTTPKKKPYKGLPKETTNGCQ